MTLEKAVLAAFAAAAVYVCFRWLHENDVSLGEVEIAQPSEMPDAWMTKRDAQEHLEKGTRMPRTLWNDLPKVESYCVHVVRTTLAER